LDRRSNNWFIQTYSFSDSSGNCRSTKRSVYFFRANSIGTLAATTLSGALATLLLNNSGSGVGSGTTYDASAARVVSWNTIEPAVTSTNYVTKQIIVFSGSALYNG
jgi:hypothetical protein